MNKINKEEKMEDYIKNYFDVSENFSQLCNQKVKDIQGD